MRTVEFKNIQIEGFGSIVERQEFDLYRPGINIIRGPNGSGKTTVFQALYWCLYGTSLKKGKTIETWPHLRKKSWAGTFVSLQYEVGTHKYTLIRGKAYKATVNLEDGTKVKIGSSVILICDGERATEDKYKKDIQIEINKSIGYEPDIFKNSILFGQKVPKLSQETAANKSKILEQIFELDFVERAKESTTIEKEKLRSEQQNLNHRIEKSQEKVDGLEKSIEMLKTVISKAKLAYSGGKTTKEISLEIDNIDEALKAAQLELDSAEEAYSKAADTYNGVTKEIEASNKKAQSIKIQLERLNTNLQRDQRALQELSSKPIVETCNTCGSKLPNEKIKELEESLSNSKKRIKNSIKDARANISDLYENAKQLELESTGSLANQKVIQENLKALKIQVQGHVVKVATLKAQLSALESELKRAKQANESTEVKKYKKQLVKAKLLRHLQRKNVKLLTKSSVKVNKELEVAEWLLSKPLSNRGIKYFVFKQLVVDLNIALHQYSSYTGFIVKVFVDLEKANNKFRVIVEKHGVEVPLEDLSGGQSQLVDICLLFAIEDIMYAKKPCSLLIMDEIFENIDRDNIEIVSQFVQDKARNKSLFLITHLDNFHISNSNIIEIRLKKDRTLLP